MDGMIDKTVYVVSTRQMKLLDDRLSQMLAVKMSWSSELHDIYVYNSQSCLA